MPPLRPRQRLIVIFLSLPVLLTAVAVTYMTIMGRVERKERTFWEALEWAGETLTTTGYGADASWDHPLTILFVIALQFLGVFLVYMLVPYFLLPLIEERFERRLPSQAPAKLRKHIVILHFGPAVETLMEDLADANVPMVVGEVEADLARSLLHLAREDGKPYRGLYPIHQTSVAQLIEGSGLEHARALLLNGSDEENATAVLVAMELGFEGEIVAVVEEPSLRHPLEVAGATAVYTPRHELGEALAARASPKVQVRVGGIHQLSQDLRVEEIRVDPEGPCAGQTLEQAEVGPLTGATVLGLWIDGRLDTQPRADTVLTPNTILLAIGRPEALDKLRRLITIERSSPPGPIIVAGRGEVGQRIVELLEEAGESVLTLDRDRNITDVDVTGDIADPKVLESLDLERARCIVLALDNDSSTLFATLVIKGMAPSLLTLARVNHAENLDRIYRAGVDFALSISQVSGQILAQRFLERKTLALDTQLQLLSFELEEGSALVNRGVKELEIRERSACSVVAVERGDETLTRLGPTFIFQPGDTVYICGRRANTHRFSDIFS